MKTSQLFSRIVVKTFTASKSHWLIAEGQGQDKKDTLVDTRNLIDKTSFWVAGITLLFALILFFNDTGEFFGSLTAALLAAALMWVAYVLTRWLILAIKK